MDKGVGAGEPVVHLGQDGVEAVVDVGEEFGVTAAGGGAAFVRRNTILNIDRNSGAVEWNSGPMQKDADRWPGPVTAVMEIW